MIIWVFIIGISVAVGLWFAARMTRAANQADAVDADVQVYKDQLAEVDRDVARGVLDEEAAERTRVEIGRRIIAADRASKAANATPQMSPSAQWGAIAFVALALAGSVWIYAGLGAPGYGDLPLQARVDAATDARENRPGQTEAEAEFGSQPNPEVTEEFRGMVEELRTVMAERPDDVRGLALLARNEALLGEFTAARTAQEQLIAAKGDAKDVGDLITLVDLMVFAAGGHVTAEAEAVLGQVFEMDPNNGAARYYLGLSHTQTGRPDLAFALWRDLYENSAPNAPWMPIIGDSITDLAALAGVNYTAPTSRGPSAADIAAAEDMSDEDRNAMIQGMVNGLASRLASEGGPPEDWAQLIRALGVLGETDRAAAIFEESTSVFAGSDRALGLLNAAAQEAGVAE